MIYPMVYIYQFNTVFRFLSKIDVKMYIVSFPQLKMSALARKQTFMIKILIWGREYQKKINCPKTLLLLHTVSSK